MSDELETIIALGEQRSARNLDREMKLLIRHLANLGVDVLPKDEFDREVEKAIAHAKGITKTLSSQELAGFRRLPIPVRP